MGRLSDSKQINTKASDLIQKFNIKVRFRIVKSVKNIQLCPTLRCLAVTYSCKLPNLPLLILLNSHQSHGGLEICHKISPLLNFIRLDFERKCVRVGEMKKKGGVASPLSFCSCSIVPNRVPTPPSPFPLFWNEAHMP